MNGSGFSDRTRLMADVSFGGRGFSSWTPVFNICQSISKKRNQLFCIRRRIIECPSVEQVHPLKADIRQTQTLGWVSSPIFQHCSLVILCDLDAFWIQPQAIRHNTNHKALWRFVTSGKVHKSVRKTRPHDGPHDGPRLGSFPQSWVLSACENINVQEEKFTDRVCVGVSWEIDLFSHLVRNLLWTFLRAPLRLLIGTFQVDQVNTTLWPPSSLPKWFNHTSKVCWIEFAKISLFLHVSSQSSTSLTNLTIGAAMFACVRMVANKVFLVYLIMASSH